MPNCMKVGDQHAPQPGRGGKQDVDDAADEQRLPDRPAEQHVRDLGGRQIHRRHDDDVEEQPEVDRAEPAHPRRGRARVPHLVELEVGQHAEPPPQPGVEEHRRHAREEERPPDPVARDAALAHEVGDQIRRIGAERRRDHRHADQPPRRRATGREELRGARPGPPGQPHRRQERDDDRGDDDDPVEGRQLHPGLTCGRCRAAASCASARA